MTAHVIEALLLRWGDNHNGRTVTFQLPPDGEHPFRGLKCGPSNGQRLALSVALISDDETQTPHAPIPHAQTEIEAIYGKPLSRAQRAGILCADPRFRAFLSDWSRSDVTTTDEAAQAVRSICRVESRKDFDLDEQAGKRWDLLESAFRTEFAA